MEIPVHSCCSRAGYSWGRDTLFTGKTGELPSIVGIAMNSIPNTKKIDIPRVKNVDLNFADTASVIHPKSWLDPSTRTRWEH